MAKSTESNKTEKKAAVKKVSEKTKTTAKSTVAKKTSTAKKTPGAKTATVKKTSSTPKTPTKKTIDYMPKIEEEKIMEPKITNEKNKKSNKKIVPILGGIAILIALLFTGVMIAKNKANNTNLERQNTIELAKKYIENNQYEQAMDLLNKLLIKNVHDEQASKMLDDVIRLKEEKDSKSKSTQDNSSPSVNVNIDTDAMQKSLESMKEQLSKTNEANIKNQEKMNELLENNKAAEEQRKKEEEKRKAYEEDLAKKNKELQNKINKINEGIAQGKVELASGNNDAALNSFKKSVSVLPLSDGEPRFSASKHSEIASSLYEASEHASSEEQKKKLSDEAVLYAKKALQYDQKDAKSHFILGVDAEEKKDYDGALEEFEFAVKYDSTNCMYFYNLGRVQYRQKKYSLARASFSSSVKLNPNFDSAYFNLGMTNKRLNQNKEALAAFRNAHQANSQNSKAYLEEARMLFNVYKDTNGAISAYNKVVSLDPVNAQAFRECGMVYSYAEKYDKAEDCFRKALALLSPDDKDPFTYYNLSTVLYHQNKMDVAEKYGKIAYDTKDVLKSKDDKAAIVYNLALLSDQNNKTDNAIILYKEVLSIDSNNIKTKINLGVMFMAMDPPDLDTALSLFTEAYKQDANNFEANNNLGTAYLEKKDYANAITYFLNSKKINPKDSTVSENLAQAYAEAGQFDNAKTVYIEILKSNSNNLDAYIELAKVCIALKDTVSAEGYLISVQSKNPDYRKAEVESLLKTIKM